ncbi:MAG: PASTA domain-containing protein, partial [Clostridia bacterium]|nr:PASTA domain-containing protein [Clostridia bacterium]
TPCQIHEFYPDTLCERDADGTVKVLGGCEHTFAEYQDKFRVHARTLARMRDVAVLFPTYDIFDANNTAYVITEAEEGVSLETRLAELGGRLNWDEARPLFMPLLAGLRSLHAARIYHLGISPENLILGKDGRLRLRGFMMPAARAVSADLKPSLCTGYAAPEQYGFDVGLDARADVYALTATLFRVLTGNPPPDASSRSSGCNDLFVPASIAEELPDQVAVCLFNGLQVAPDKRTATVESLQESLTTSAAVANLRDEEAAAVVLPEVEEPQESKKNGKGKIIALIAIGVFLLLALLGFAIIYMLFPQVFNPDAVVSEPDSTVSLPTVSIYEDDESSYIEYDYTYSVPNVVNKNYYELLDQKLNGDMKLEVSYMIYDNGKAAGTILSQEPKAEASVEKGATIKVVISLGKEEITVPDLTGWSEEHARLYLEALGFRVSESIDKLISEHPYGMVDSTDLEVGTKVKPGAAIILYVSKQEEFSVEESVEESMSDTTEESDTVEESSNGGFWFW